MLLADLKIQPSNKLLGH